jgi:hypothetical protein
VTCVPDDDGDSDGSAGDSHSALATVASRTTCTTVTVAVTPAMPRLVLHCLALISHEPSARGTLRSEGGPSSRGSSSPLWNAPPAKGQEQAANESRPWDRSRYGTRDLYSVVTATVAQLDPVFEGGTRFFERNRSSRKGGFGATRFTNTCHRRPPAPVPNVIEHALQRSGHAAPG